MTVHPDAGELLRASAQIHLIFKHICHRFIIKPDTGESNFLFDSDKFLDMKQIICRSNTKTADFVFRFVTEVQ